MEQMCLNMNAIFATAVACFGQTNLLFLGQNLVSRMLHKILETGLLHVTMFFCSVSSRMEQNWKKKHCEYATEAGLGTKLQVNHRMIL